MEHGTPIDYLRTFKSVKISHTSCFIYYSSYLLFGGIILNLWDYYSITFMNDWELVNYIDGEINYKGLQIIFAIFSLVAATAINLEANNKIYSVYDITSSKRSALEAVILASNFYVGGSLIPIGLLLADFSDAFTMTLVAFTVVGFYAFFNLVNSLLKIDVADDN